MKIKFLLTMAIPLLLIACDKEDKGGGGDGNASTPVTFIASIQPEANTRITVNNGWSGLADSKMAISIDGTVKEYAVSEIGEVTSSEPFYWGDKESITVDAWYPYNNGVKPETIIVSADQSVDVNYEKSDYLEVVGVTVTSKKSTLIFTHRTAKVVCKVTSEYGDAQSAQVVLYGLSGVDEGTSVKTTSRLKALVVPQIIPAGTGFIKVSLEAAGNHTYVLDKDLVLKSGTQYEADVNITFQGVEVTFREAASWTADTEETPGITPEVNTGEADGWTAGGEEERPGTSSEVNADNGSVEGWDGNEEEVPATGENPHQ